MEFFEVINARRSCRRFIEGGEVTDEQINRILEAALLAPSGGNLQPWLFRVIRNQQTKDALVPHAHKQKYISQAPVVIAVIVEPERSARYGERGTGLYCIQDTAAAIEHILLAATALGLGGVWIGAYEEQGVTEVLKLDEGQRPIALIPIGVPHEQGFRTRNRRPMEEVVSYDL